MISNFIDQINSINLFDICMSDFCLLVIQCFLKGFSQLDFFMKWVLSNCNNHASSKTSTNCRVYESQFINN